MKNLPFLLLLPALLVFFSCDGPGGAVAIEHGGLVLAVDNQMQTKISSKATDKPFMEGFRETEYLALRSGRIGGFKQESHTVEEGPVTVHTFSGANPDGVRKTLTIRLDERFPGLATFQVAYANQGEKTFDVERWVNHDYAVESAGDAPLFWSFNGSSTSAREDWIQPVDTVFNKKNYLGMNNADYGGGIPVSDLWRRDGGIAIGHTELTPKLVSLPVEKARYEQQAQMRVEYEYPWEAVFRPGDELSTFETFVSVHQGDCFSTLRQFSQLMRAKGMQFVQSPPSAFEPMWCAWGYERDFTLEEVIGTLPKVAELGLKWATLDDGFQITEGDWTTNREKFPNGEADMRRLVKAIHDAGLKAQIWWAPLAVSPDSRLLREHPNILLRTSEWAPQYITWWDAWYMAPTDSVVLQHTKDVVTMFIRDWDFDGLKLDGQHLNAVEPDHGDHGQEYPEQAVEELPDFFHLIYNTATGIKPDALIQHCPCGTCMSFYNMPATNQTVSSDPLDSRQIRQKGKVYKAIIPEVAYFGDHVELSDDRSDFASSFGVGAVLGTKFTWPKDNPSVSPPGYLLTPEKEVIWKKWISLYNEKMLSKEPYLGDLYDIGYDMPETHVIRKGEALYYAFYAKKWDGPVELRGLEQGKTYRLRDYFNGVDLGEAVGETGRLDAKFEGFLLIEAAP
jgi:alpha-galactosidase